MAIENTEIKMTTLASLAMTSMSKIVLTIPNVPFLILMIIKGDITSTDMEKRMNALLIL